MKELQVWIPLIARISIATLFILAGWNKISGFESTVGQIATAGLPMPELLTVLTIIVEIGGGLSIITGFMSRWAALALVGFTALATFFFHNDIANPLQMIMALKNLSIIGGLLMIYAMGPGPKSLCCPGGTCSCCKVPEEAK